MMMSSGQPLIIYQPILEETHNIGLLQIETKYTTSLMTPQLLDSLSGCSITGKNF